MSQKRHTLTTTTTMPRILMFSHNAIEVPAILIVVIGGSDLAYWMVPSKIVSILFGFRAKPLRKNQI